MILDEIHIPLPTKKKQNKSIIIYKRDDKTNIPTPTKNDKHKTITVTKDMIDK